MPRPFSSISFGLWEPGLKDSSFGKVSIPISALQAEPIREERWYAVRQVDADSEVQVCMCVNIRVCDMMRALFRA